MAPFTVSLTAPGPPSIPAFSLGSQGLSEVFPLRPTFEYLHSSGPRTSTSGVLFRSPGLRRRELLGVGGDASTQELAPVSGAWRREAGGSPVPGSGLSALLTTASGERSVASLSATQKYREQRELERYASDTGGRLIHCYLCWFYLLERLLFLGQGDMRRVGSMALGNVLRCCQRSFSAGNQPSLAKMPCF